MGETAESFSALKVLRQIEAKERREIAPQKLADAGIEFQAFNGGAHFKLTVKELLIDFWPGTDRWKIKGQRSQFGIEQLIAFVNAQMKA